MNRSRGRSDHTPSIMRPGSSALGLVPTATAKAGRASIAACQRVKLGIGRALDRKFQTTLDDRTERNVGDGETIERKPMRARRCGHRVS